MAQNIEKTRRREGNPQRGKRFHSGLVSGGFRPLHRGHCYLIDTAIDQCDKVTIMVGSLANETIDGHLRYEWVRNTYEQPDVTVIHNLEDDLPDWTLLDYWERWVANYGWKLPAVDAVFSSESYGSTLAAALGAVHIEADRERRNFPVSGSMIRANPLQYWDYLAPVTRNYFAKRVLIFGCESTGKTTLCEQLAQHYNTMWVPEWARDYMKGNGNRFQLADVDRIVVGQLEAEEQAALHCNRLVFCDTDPLLTRVYADCYIGECPLYLQRLANERRYDVYLFTETDLPWEDDGERDRPTNRELLRRVLLSALESRRIPFHIVSGSGPARLKSAIDVIDTKIGEWGISPELLTSRTPSRVTWPNAAPKRVPVSDWYNR